MNSNMTYQATLDVPGDIAHQVSGKYIEIINEITGELQKYRETVYNLSEAHCVDIKYNKHNEQFIVSGLKTNVDKAYLKLKEIVKDKEDDQLAYKERKRQQKLNHQEYLLRKKRREMYKQNKEIESGKHQKKNENKREAVILDKRNPFYMLSVEDSDDEYFQRVELKKEYDENKQTFTKDINNLTSKLDIMKAKLVHMPTPETLKKSKLSDEEVNKHLDAYQKLQDTINKTKLEIEKLQRNNEMTFEQYEDQVNGVEPEETFTDLTNENSDNEEDIHFDVEVEEKTTDTVSDDIREAEMEQYIAQNSIPRNRSSYQKKQYKNKEDNTSKSGSWTYVSSGGKARTNQGDKKRHYNPGPRHHNRNPNKFNKHDFNEELEIAEEVTDRRIPTDNFRDLLGEITGENYLSEFPPLVSN
jgi:hypothetical protein